LFKKDLSHKIAGSDDLGIRDAIKDVQPFLSGLDDPALAHHGKVLG
jgi:hypothetical protein